MKLPNETIKERLQDVNAAPRPLQPIMPEVERLLGPAQPVAGVLAALDRQYKEEGRPAVSFLSPAQPLAPHLDALFRPNPEALIAAGVRAYRHGDYASAIAYYDESLKLLADHQDPAAITFVARMNRAATLRDLGEAEQARAELRKLLAGADAGHPITALAKGRAHYHLALCDWRLNDREAAQREAQASLQTYGDNADAAALKEQTAQLLTDLRENKSLPSLAPVDAVVAVQTARTRLRAGIDLATLPLDQSALSLLDHLLGPAEPTRDVFERLDRQYREQNKPEIWFLPLTQPIAPSLDGLLGPALVQEKPE
jgi:tetratricopeptide (TPR) repeat protein